jgi:hypothetical protein
MHPTTGPTSDAAADLMRLHAAAHELAHAIAFRVAGVDIEVIRVKGHGPTAEGYVRVPDPDTGDAAVLRGYVVAGLAGGEASLLWCAENNLRFDPSMSSDDLDLVRQLCRTSHGRRIRKGAAVSEARRIVRAHWPAITQLAPALARVGRISPARLPR